MTETKLMLGIYDCIFKAIMLNKNNRDYLIGLIHHITGIKKEDLTSIEVESPEYIVNNKKDKKMQSDIIVSVGKLVLNIEMNKDYYKGVFLKNDAYINKLSSELYTGSIDHKDTKVVIQINFDNFNYFKGNKEIYKFEYRDGEIILPENPIKYHVDLAFIHDTCYNKPVRNLSEFERYCLLLIAETKEFADKIAGDDVVMKNISENLESLNEDKKIIGLYDAEKEEEKIRRTQIAYAKEEIQIEVAKNMISKGFDKNTISELVGISIEDIEKIQSIN